VLLESKKLATREDSLRQYPALMGMCTFGNVASSFCYSLAGCG